MTERTEIDDPLMRETADEHEPRAPKLRRGNLRHLGTVGANKRNAAELRSGDVLEARYALLSPLGEGGMGDVWLAHNTMLDVEVALKVLRVSDDQPERRGRLTQRLLQEARAAAKLDHPAIVRITDFGETPSGNAFFVMELLEGEDLHSLLERHGRLSTTEAVRTLLPIAGALVAAHAKDIVHRDLKPENIFLTRNEEEGTVQPKLIDFGVAKLSVANERITIAGTVMGSPGYMAPEQARGEDVDERADVWGFSVVLYETITGRLPFEGKNYNALMRSIIEDQPSPMTSFGVGDDVLSEIIERGLAKDPDRRWQSIRELGSALARWLLQRGITEDICGTRLTATWIRERSEVSFGSGSPPSPLVSTPIPGPMMSEARRGRAELETEPPPALSTVSASGSLPPLPSAPFIRSRAITVAALTIGAFGGLILGVWALGHSPELPLAVSSTSADAAVTAAAERATSPDEGSRSSDSACERSATGVGTALASSIATPSRPRRAGGLPAAPVPAESAAPSPPGHLPMLKNPF